MLPYMNWPKPFGGLIKEVIAKWGQGNMPVFFLIALYSAVWQLDLLWLCKVESSLVCTLYIAIYTCHTLPTIDGFELALEERYRRTLLEIDSLKEDLGEKWLCIVGCVCVLISLILNHTLINISRGDLKGVCVIVCLTNLWHFYCHLVENMIQLLLIFSPMLYSLFSQFCKYEVTCHHGLSLSFLFTSLSYLIMNITMLCVAIICQYLLPT